MSCLDFFIQNIKVFRTTPSWTGVLCVTYVQTNMGTLGRYYEYFETAVSRGHHCTSQCDVVNPCCTEIHRVSYLISSNTCPLLSAPVYYQRQYYKHYSEHCALSVWPSDVHPLERNKTCGLNLMTSLTGSLGKNPHSPDCRNIASVLQIFPETRCLYIAMLQSFRHCKNQQLLVKNL